MTAPALVLLAHGSADSEAMTSMHAMRKGMQECRSEVPVQLAFIEHCPPSGPQVVSQLARRGTEEVVFVPLEIGSVTDPSPSALDVVERTRLANPGIRLAISRPIGPEPGLLSIVDARLRHALRARRVDALDALVLSVQGSHDPRSRAVLARRCRQWSAHHKIPATVAYGDGTGQSVTEAVAHLRAEGRRHIAVASWYFTASHAWRRQADAALAAGAVAVSAPLGDEPSVRELVLSRYVVAAMAMLDVDQAAPASAVG